MAFARPYTLREMDYIRENWQTKTVREMADELGRSERGVYKKIRDMHLRDGAAAQPRAPMQREPKKAPAVQGKPARGAPGCIARHGGDRGRLEGLRDLIWASLEEASPADVARLAPEYRKTIEEIERMGGDDGKQAREAPGGAADGLAEILSL